jgi:hypothetical protein
MPASVEDRMAKLGFPPPSAKTIPKDEDKPAMVRKKAKPKATKKRTKKKGIS